MTELNKTSDRKNYFWGLGRPRITPHRPAESVVLLTGRRAAEIHERCRAAESERSTGLGWEGEAASG